MVKERETARTFGEVLAAGRKELRWTQSEMGTCLGVSVRTIVRWEYDDRVPGPRAASDLLRRIHAADVTVAEHLAASLGTDAADVRAVAITPRTRRRSFAACHAAATEDDSVEVAELLTARVSDRGVVEKRGHRAEHLASSREEIRKANVPLERHVTRVRARGRQEREELLSVRVVERGERARDRGALGLGPRELVFVAVAQSPCVLVRNGGSGGRRGLPLRARRTCGEHERERGNESPWSTCGSMCGIRHAGARARRARAGRYSATAHLDQARATALASPSTSRRSSRSCRSCRSWLLLTQPDPLFEETFPLIWETFPFFDQTDLLFSQTDRLREHPPSPGEGTAAFFAHSSVLRVHTDPLGA
jgi:transcriptional regulator with XRE-family HTH domain